MIDRVNRRCKWSCQVVITVRDIHFEERVEVHRFAQILRHIQVTVFLVAPVRPQAWVEDFIRQVALEFQLGAHVFVKGRRVGPHDVCHAGVVFVELSCGIAVFAFESAVDAANRLALVAQQLFCEAVIVDAQVGALDVVARKPCKTRQFAHDAVAFLVRQRRAFQQGQGIFPKRELGRLLHSFSEIFQ